MDWFECKHLKLAATVAAILSLGALAIWLGKGLDRSLDRAGLETQASKTLPQGAKGPSSAGARPAPRVPGFRDCPHCPELVVVPAGKNFIGASVEEEGREVELPRYQANLPSTAIGRYEVTKTEWEAFAAATGHPQGTTCTTYEEGFWADRQPRSWRNPGFEQAGQEPVVCVNWWDALAYVNWLSETTGQDYRLPSEAVWEYAARGGISQASYWADSPTRACEYGNVHDRTSAIWNGLDWIPFECDDGAARTSGVGLFADNAFGLHDMLGNVWEWTADCWNDSHAGAPRDGSARRDGDCGRRVIRGGAWNSQPTNVRFAFRYGSPAQNRYDKYGFRVSRTMPSQGGSAPPRD